MHFMQRRRGGPRIRLVWDLIVEEALTNAIATKRTLALIRGYLGILASRRVEPSHAKVARAADEGEGEGRGGDKEEQIE